MIIRDEQLALFDADRAEVLEQRLVDMTAQHWPALLAEHGQRGTRDRIRAAIGRARSWGITAERDLQRWLNIDYALGPGFDRNPEYPWAALLLKERILTPSARVDRLCWWTAKVLRRG